MLSHELMELDQQRKHFNQQADKVIDNLKVIRMNSLDNYTKLKKNADALEKRRQQTASLRDNSQVFVEKATDAPIGR